jgi:hypothetical protein
MAQVTLIGCHTLGNEEYAAAWARVCNGNLYGTYYSLAINLYAMGIYIPGFSRLTKYEKGRKRTGNGMKKGRHGPTVKNPFHVPYKQK